MGAAGRFSAQSLTAAGSERTGLRIGTGIVCVLLATWALVDLASDRSSRRPAEAFARRYGLDRRRPLEVAAMRLATWPDGSAAAATDAALEAGGERSDSVGAPDMIGTEAGSLPAAALKEGRDLMLDAVARRPGWGLHRFLLGRIERRLQESVGQGEHDPLQWFVPLELAGVAAPGMDPVYAYLSAAVLESWLELPSEVRKEAPALLRRAFLDDDSVSRGLLSARIRLGSDAAIELLPDAADPLLAASHALIQSGDVVAAARLQPRLRAASSRERDDGLRAIARRRAAGDLSGARSRCEASFRRFPPQDFDDAPGRAQSARLLALWPNDVDGVWRTDPRGELARFFLDREEDAPAEAMLSVLEVLSAVPEPVEARIRLLAGDEIGAMDLMRRSGAGSAYEWVPFRLAAARAALKGGDAGKARALVGGLSATVAEGCDALFCRRDIAKALGDTAEEAYAEGRLGAMDRISFPPEAWSESGSMTVCIPDPGVRRLRVEIGTDRPAIVRFGRDGGRTDAILVMPGDGSHVLPVPLSGGRQTLSVSAEAGGPIRLGAATLERGG